MARPLCSPRLMCSPAKASANVIVGTEAESSGASSTIDAAVPPELDMHIVLYDYRSYKTPLIHRCLAKRPRFHLHFTPTGASWMNLAERFFATLTKKKLRRGTHRSTAQVETGIKNYLGLHNDQPHPFIWHKTADELLESLARFCKRTLNPRYWGKYA